MQLIRPTYEILTEIDGLNILKNIERAGRVCYKSEDKITDDSCIKFCKNIIKSGHESVIEHENISVKFICSRSFANELVRHRLCSYSQESTRYCSSSSYLKTNINNNDDIIKLYQDGNSMKTISQISNGKYTEWEVYKTLNKNNIKRRGLHNTGIIYEDFFDNIDTVEKAYLLGLILADGSIRNNELKITQKSDIFWYIWRMVRDLIKPNLNSHKDRNCRAISISNTHLINNLINKGIIQNKTYDFAEKESLLLWHSIPDSLKMSFLRGFLDGDGSIRFYYQQNKGRTFSTNIQWLGPQSFLKIISDYISNKYNYNGSVKHVYKTKQLYRFNINSPEVGKKVCEDMLCGFKFPYGNPIKTSRMFEYIDKKIEFNSWGDNKFQIIIPPICQKVQPHLWKWAQYMDKVEKTYGELIQGGWTPQEARSVLPNSLKTEIVCTTNIREWRHILKLRTSKAAHPEMRQLMIPLLKEFQAKIPILFEDINEKNN